MGTDNKAEGNILLGVFVLVVQVCVPLALFYITSITIGFITNLVIHGFNGGFELFNHIFH